MADLAFIRSAFKRNNGDQVEARLINVFMEASPVDTSGEVMLSRAGLTTHLSPGASSAPVRGMFSKADLFGGDIFSVVGSNIYRNTTLIGTLAGTGPVSFATDGIDEILITAGSTMRRYNGALADVTFPDSAGVLKVAFINGLFVAVRAGSGRFYWSAVNDGSSWNALDYATAESAADYLLDLEVIGDITWLLGKETVEPWAITSSLDLPFRRIEQRLYKRGVIATGAATEIGGRLFWVGDDARVYTDDLTPVSDEGIAERIRASTSWSMFSLTYEGHPFVCIRLDTETWVYSPQTVNWVQFTTYNRPNWRVRSAMSKGTTVYLGDDELNRIWTFGGSTENGDVIERVFAAFIPITGGTMHIDNLGMTANVGRTEALAGAGSNPVMEMRTSRDEGKNWSTWRAQSLGTMGQYRKRVRFNRCGMFDAPGALAEFRCTDVVPLRISGLFVNEPGGGRSR